MKLRTIKNLLFTVLLCVLSFQSYSQNNKEAFMQTFQNLKTMLESPTKANFKQAVFKVENAF